MTTHIEIVSVTYRRGKTGERTPCIFEDFGINRPHPDEWAEDLPLYDSSGDCFEGWPPSYGTDAYLDLPTDWYGLRFAYIGQFCEGQQSALEYECENDSAAYVFEDYANNLRVIGDKLLDAEHERLCETTRRNYGIWESSYPEKPKEVTFLTAWEYRCGRDYDGEWDSEWDLLGQIDLSKIKTLIIPISAPQEVSCQPQ